VVRITASASDRAGAEGESLPRGASHDRALKWLDRGPRCRKVGLPDRLPYGTLPSRGGHEEARVLAFRARREAVARWIGGIEVLDAPLARSARRCSARTTRSSGRSRPAAVQRHRGNAYSDEISIGRGSRRADHAQAFRRADRAPAQRHAGCLREWIDRLTPRRRGASREGHAFREGMAVHGRYRKPCPVCGTACSASLRRQRDQLLSALQTEGRILSIALSRLLKSDWPRSIEELEEKLPTRAPKTARRPRRDTLRSGTHEVLNQPAPLEVNFSPPTRAGQAVEREGAAWATRSLELGQWAGSRAAQAWAAQRTRTRPVASTTATQSRRRGGVPSGVARAHARRGGARDPCFPWEEDGGRPRGPRRDEFVDSQCEQGHGVHLDDYSRCPLRRRSSP